MTSRVCDGIVSSAIVLSLRDGMSSFNNLCDSLLSVDTDLISHDASEYESIRDVIVKAKQDMEKTDQEAEGELKRLDADTEKPIEQQTRFESEREEKKLTLGNLNIQLNADKESLNSSVQGLGVARSGLQNAENVLNSQNRKKRRARKWRNIGLLVSPIPYVGWVAGPAMAIGGAVGMDQAQRAVHTAREEVQKSESLVQNFSRRVSDCQSEISKREQGIRQTEEDLKHTAEKIVKVKQQREALAEFQMKMRSAVHLLGRLSGTANVLELQTQRFILLGPVMKVIEDVVKVAGEIAGNHFLQDNGVMSLVDAMRENKRLAAVCASHNNPALENYS